MKDRILTICIREIKKSYKRFLSLLVMSFLGVAVFVGMRLASKTMIDSLDRYYDNQQVYDMKVISTLGLTEEDVKDIEELSLVENARGIHTKDVTLENKGATYVMRISAIQGDINKIEILEGRFPTSKEEIVVEKHFLETTNLKIGESITLEDPDHVLKTQQFQIVGIVQSPIYLVVGGPTLNRGTTTIGNGSVNYFAYAIDDLFEMDYYSEIDITLKDAKELVTSEKDYKELVDYGIGEITAIKKYREQARYDEIYNQAMKEIKKQEEEGNQKLKEAEGLLTKSKKDLDRGLSTLNSKKNLLESSQKELYEGEQEIIKTKNQIQEGYNQLQQEKEKIENGKKEIEKELNKYHLTMEDILTLIDIWNHKTVPKESLKKIVKEDFEYKEDIDLAIDYLYNHGYPEKMNEYMISGYEQAKKDMIKGIPTTINHYDEVISYIQNLELTTVQEEVLQMALNTKRVEILKKHVPTYLTHYDEIQSFLNQYINSIEGLKQLIDAIQALTKGEKIIKDKEAELNKASILVNEKSKEIERYKHELEQGRIELQNGYNTYYRGLNKYNEGWVEYQNQRLDFERKIKEAKEDVESMQKPTWYIQTREDNSDYTTYIGIGESIEKLAASFPTIFFIVAIFMSMMSMSRMALEDRTEIGTLKALGFSNIHIMMKYIIYSIFATLIGGIFGSVFGMYFLTYFIWKMYQILFTLPVFAIYHNPWIIVIGILLAIICITGSTIWTIKSIIKENAASLMRPKSPKGAKNFFFERSHLWKRISFSNKVTIKNILRYKKRVFMTVVGIMGCTILLLTGYGIRDSIVNIPTKQFDEILCYDDLIYYTQDQPFDEKLLNNPHIKSKVHGKFTQSTVGNLAVYLVALDDPSTSNQIFKLHSIENHQEIKLEDNKIVISSKLASINHLKKGDSLSVKTSDNKEYNLVIDDIFENYVAHYILMNKSTYQKEIGEYQINMSYIKMEDKNYEKELTTELMKNEKVSMIMNVENTQTTIDQMLKSLDNVVLILFVFSGLLSFVVLYNLSYINISERKREIASLKVLGFYNLEVDNYIIKENFIITIMGILLGMILGLPFVNFIVSSIEMDLVQFLKIITIESYIKTFAFMIGFTIIVSIIIHFTLQKINMIDSLKSVE